MKMSWPLVNVKWKVIVYQFESVGGEHIVRGDDDGVEPDVGREVLPQPLVVPQVVRVLATGTLSGQINYKGSYTWGIHNL